jgi:hypothetical protein
MSSAWSQGASCFGPADIRAADRDFKFDDGVQGKRINPRAKLSLAFPGFCMSAVAVDESTLKSTHECHNAPTHSLDHQNGRVRAVCKCGSNGAEVAAPKPEEFEQPKADS